MIRWTLAGCVALVAASGCHKTQQADPASLAASAAPGAEPRTALADDQIPTQEDFEPEAEQRIDSANLEASLAELEREVSK